MSKLNFYDIVETNNKGDDRKPMRQQLPPTPGFNKLKPAARNAALSRAKAFYPFDEKE